MSCAAIPGAHPDGGLLELVCNEDADRLVRKEGEDAEQRLMTDSIMLSPVPALKKAHLDGGLLALECNEDADRPFRGKAPFCDLEDDDAGDCAVLASALGSHLVL